MKTLLYGFFGEDDTSRLFLKNYLFIIGDEWQISFLEDKSFTYRYQAHNKAQVDSLFDEACQAGLSQYDQDCFFRRA